MSNNISTQRAAIESLLDKTGFQLLDFTLLPATRVELEDGTQLFFCGVSNGKDNRSKYKKVKIIGFSTIPDLYNPKAINEVPEAKLMVLIRPLEANDDLTDIDGNLENIMTVEKLEVVSNDFIKLVLKRTGDTKSFIKLI